MSAISPSTFAVPFEACEHMPGQVSSTALVRYRLVDYSAPTMHAQKKVTVKGYVDRVEIALGAECGFWST